ncbi:tRNA dihydrouridine(20/20a) synthase DusA [Myxococcota bacterium]|nr:tRNA dihydrouridine(20/20a) synthase DusA [Myxococcota bacterium]
MSWPRAAIPPLSVAPMLDHTDRHFRWLVRQVSRHTLLYTEMVVAQALVHGPRERLLTYDPVEHPVALQLGGDDPALLARCARMAVDAGYDEININVGCPSDRVQSGCFGAVLMRRPDLVARIVAAVREAVGVPVTVKHRIGVDELDSYEHMLSFVDTVAAAGADRFTVHARKAWLEGLSPRENRTIPPLRYGDVHRLKRERPHLPVELNGGVQDLDQAIAQLHHVDAVMMGRAVAEDPWVLRHADARLFCGPGAGLAADPRELLVRAQEYAAREISRGQRLGSIARHLQGLFKGQPGARAFRRHLSDHAFREGAPATVLGEAVEAMDRARDRAERDPGADPEETGR